MGSGSLAKVSIHDAHRDEIEHEIRPVQVDVVHHILHATEPSPASLGTRHTNSVAKASSECVRLLHIKGSHLQNMSPYSIVALKCDKTASNRVVALAHDIALIGESLTCVQGVMEGELLPPLITKAGMCAAVQGERRTGVRPRRVA